MKGRKVVQSVLSKINTRYSFLLGLVLIRQHHIADKFHCENYEKFPIGFLDIQWYYFLSYLVKTDLQSNLFRSSNAQ